MTFTETWRGEAINWECDELGHLNMRHYITKAQQARQMFIMQLGLSHAFKKGTPGAVRVREFHIKYIREAMPGAPLHIESAITSLGEKDLALIHIMYHQDGSIAATIHEALEHFYMPTHRSFAWPERLREQATLYMSELPEAARPRGIPDIEMQGANYETVKNWGCSEIGRGVFQRSEVGSSDTVCAQHMLGHISESIRHFDTAFPEKIGTGPITGVLLELKFRFHTFPEAGDPFVIASGIMGVTDKVRRLVHHIVNPITGMPYASAIAINGLIDLEKRRLVVPSKINNEKLTNEIITNLHP